MGSSLACSYSGLLAMNSQPGRADYVRAVLAGLERSAAWKNTTRSLAEFLQEIAPKRFGHYTKASPQRNPQISLTSLKIGGKNGTS